MPGATEDLSVFVHIVTYNSASFITQCIQSLLSQQEFSVGQNLIIHITDNASTDETCACIQTILRSGVVLNKKNVNLGFCAGHNEGARTFLESTLKYLLIINPDVRLEEDALIKLVRKLEQRSAVGVGCPKLYRADDSLQPVSPPEFDSTGMYMTTALRHFDRGSGEQDIGQYSKDSLVFGASGACMLMKRDFVKEMLLEGEHYEQDIAKVYPFLLPEREKRAPLFDEAFFAYREDADLAWRAQIAGWKCLYVASACGYHRRKVLPERRAELPPELNLYSVRNRFLLQLNNFSFTHNASTILPGLLWRNLVVLAGTVLLERSSLPALLHIIKLRRRALERRRKILKRYVRSVDNNIARWFNAKPYSEPAP